MDRLGRQSRIVQSRRQAYESQLSQLAAYVSRRLELDARVSHAAYYRFRERDHYVKDESKEIPN